MKDFSLLFELKHGMKARKLTKTLQKVVDVSDDVRFIKVSFERVVLPEFPGCLADVEWFS